MKTTTLILISVASFFVVIVGAVLKIEGSKWSPFLLLTGLGLSLGLVVFLILDKLKQSRQKG
jgi:dipeptide/tripeptide permease